MQLSARNLLKEFEKYKKAVNPFAAVCQCRHETSYNGHPWSSELCLKANNLAGLKRGMGWTGQIYPKVSWEEKPNGERYEQVSEFRRYIAWEDFVYDYAGKIEKDYPVCASSADNFFGYFSGLFRGRFGAWATDLSYLDRLMGQMFSLAPEIFGGGWIDKVWTAYEFAAANGRLTPEHEKAILSQLESAIPRGKPLFEEAPLICIDPGHGYPDPGAVGLKGSKESDIALLVANYIGQALSTAGYRVDYTRKDKNGLSVDKSIDLKRRVEKANSQKADAFVSIHCNAAENRQANGLEVLKYPSSQAAGKLSAEILSELASAAGLRNRGLKDRTDLYVLRNTLMPACLVELAFISNLDEEKLLLDTEWQVSAGRAIADGIEKYFGK